MSYHLHYLHNSVTSGGITGEFRVQQGITDSITWKISLAKEVLVGWESDVQVNLMCVLLHSHPKWRNFMNRNLDENVQKDRDEYSKSNGIRYNHFQKGKRLLAGPETGCKKTAGIPWPVSGRIAYFAAFIRFPIIHLPPL